MMQRFINYTKIIFIFFFVLNVQADELPDFRKGKEKARTLFAAGLTYFNNYQYGAAKESFRGVLSILDNFDIARRFLADAYFLSGEWQEGLNELEILEKNKKNLQARNRAEVLRLLIAGSGKKQGLTYFKHISGDDFRGYRFKSPTDAFVDPDGNLFVLSFNSNNIIKFDPNGIPIGNFKGGFGRTFEGPVFFANYMDKIFVSDFASDKVYILNLKGYFQDRFGAKGIENGKFLGPSGIAVSKDDKLYIADSGNNRIQKFTLDGKFLTKFGEEGQGKLSNPFGITIDEDNTIYVADKGNKRIVHFDDEGNFIKEFTHPSIQKPRSIKIFQNRFYIADELNGMLIYNPTKDKWTRLKTYKDSTGSTTKLLKPFSTAYDYTGALYTVDHARHRIDVFAPKNTITSNLNVMIEKVDIKNFPDVSVFLRVKNRSNQDIRGLNRTAFRVTENENIYPLVNIADMKHFKNNMSVSLVFENSPKIKSVSKNLDGLLGHLFRPFIKNDKVEVIRAGKDAEKIYSYGHSILDIFAKIRNSKPEKSHINLGKALFQGTNDLLNEIGPKAVVLFVSGEELPDAFKQYSLVRNIQFANAHSIPIIVLSLTDKGEMANVYKDLAEKTGGMFLKVPGSPQEKHLYKYIKSNSDKRYILTYKSKVDKELYGRYLDLMVEVSYRDIIGKAKSGFFIPDAK